MDSKALLKQAAEEKPLYSHFNGIAFLESVALRQTPWRGTTSKWSLLFVVEGNKSVNCTLKDVFGITCAAFDGKFDEAVSGLEKSNILKLHSSSLAALLLLHAVSEENPIYIPINDVPVKFTKVEFEVRNMVDKTDSKTKSNIDIVLSGDGYKLYLESKFSEYLGSGTQEISGTDYYKDFLGKMRCSLEAAGLTLEIPEGNGNIKLSGRGMYCEGPKQMICHYLGIKTAIKGGKIDDKNQHIVLGEALFNFGDISNKKYERYEKIYKKLKVGLVERAEDDKIKLTINHLITYQQIFKLEENRAYLEKMPANIRAFYRL